jgi:DNA-binding winged helix-turn-helix (wHTH) protein
MLSASGPARSRPVSHFRSRIGSRLSFIFRPGVKPTNMGLQIAERAARGDRDAGGFPARYARFGAFQLDRKRQDLTKNGARLRLPGKVCQVLVTLLERHGEIVTREELRARLWGSDTHVNFDANVNTTVNKLRQILGDSNEQSIYVQTIPRRGYSFIGTVEFLDQPELLGATALGAASAGAAAEEAVSAEDSLQPNSSSAAARSSLFAPHRATVWFTVGVIALVVAAMLLGAAITLFSYRPF